MSIFRLKNNFTSGEISPLMEDRTDFERFKNGCKTLKNMVVRTQGPVSRRSGFQFIYSLNDIGLDLTDPKVRMVDFVFNELQSYILVFYLHTSGAIRIVFATEEGLVETGGSIVYLDMPSGFDIDAFDHAQSGDYLYVAQSTLSPHAIVRNSHTSWAINAITFASQPTDWSSTNGWPETVTFFQQRLAYGGNLLRRQTIWLSKAGDFHDFGISSPLVDSDALTFTLDSGTQNKIQWLQAVKSLHAGTLGNEWTVSGGSFNSVTPTNVLALRQTNNGSERIKPLMVGLTTLFVERFARVINEFIYDYQYESFKTSDMTILAPHFTDYTSIIDWAYQQTPDSIIWVLMDDGTLKGLTYQRQHKVVGWHQHDTEGEFKAIAVKPGDDREDEVWVVVKREINGTDSYYIEKKAVQFIGTEASEGRFLDSFLVYDGASTDTITGLDHLEGEMVDVLIEGATITDQLTVSSGSITLPYEGTQCVVGLGFESEVRPHSPEVPSQNGTSLMRRQSLVSAKIGLHKSLGMSFGIDNAEDGESVEERPFRKPWDLTGTALPLVTGIYESDGIEGYDNKAEYFIRQTQPLPLTVTGVVEEIELEDD